MVIQSFIKGVDALNEWVGKTVSWLFLLLIAAVCTDLFVRAVTGKSTDWAFDINYMIYGTNFMLAGAYTLKYDGHVRVDVLYNSFSPKTQAILDIIFYLAVMLPLCVFMLYSTWIDFLISVENREVSIASAWHPPVYHYKFVMPLAFALLLLQSLVQFIRKILILSGREQDVG